MLVSQRETSIPDTQSVRSADSHITVADTVNTKKIAFYLTNHGDRIVRKKCGNLSSSPSLFFLLLLLLVLPFQSKGLRPEALRKEGFGRTSTPLSMAVRYMKANVFLALFRAHLGTSTSSSPSAAAAAPHSSSTVEVKSLLEQKVIQKDENGQLQAKSVRQWGELWEKKGRYGLKSASFFKNVCQLLDEAEKGERERERERQTKKQIEL